MRSEREDVDGRRDGREVWCTWPPAAGTRTALCASLYPTCHDFLHSRPSPVLSSSNTSTPSPPHPLYASSYYHPTQCWSLTNPRCNPLRYIPNLPLNAIAVALYGLCAVIFTFCTSSPFPLATNVQTSSATAESTSYASPSALGVRQSAWRSV